MGVDYKKYDKEVKKHIIKDSFEPADGDEEGDLFSRRNQSREK